MVLTSAGMPIDAKLMEWLGHDMTQMYKDAVNACKLGYPLDVDYVVLGNLYEVQFLLMSRLLRLPVSFRKWLWEEIKGTFCDRPRYDQGEHGCPRQWPPGIRFQNVTAPNISGIMSSLDTSPC